MRRYSLMSLVVLLALSIGALACDSGTAALNNQTPQEMLKAALEASRDVTSQAGTYEVAVTLDADPGQMSGEEAALAQAFLSAPITLSGDFASQTAPLAVDLSMSTSLMGMGLQAGITLLDSGQYINLLGQWYEAPAELNQQLTGVDVAAISDTAWEAMDELSIDPASWFTDLKKAGEEKLVDTDVVHLTASVDLNKMVTDVVALMQSEKMAELMTTLSGSAAQSALGDLQLPTQADLDEALPMIEQMFEGTTVDLWLAKSDSTIRKMALNANMAIPQEIGLTGLNGATIVATINLDEPNRPLSIKAPDSPKPFAQLEQDLQNNPLLSGLLEGLMGTASGSDSPFGF
jgi:hypothetical protein